MELAIKTGAYFSCYVFTKFFIFIIANDETSKKPPRKKKIKQQLKESMMNDGNVNTDTEESGRIVEKVKIKGRFLHFLHIFDQLLWLTRKQQALF